MKLVLKLYLSTAEETEAASEVVLDAFTQTVWWSWGVGVWRDTYPTRRDTRLGSPERDKMRFLDLKKILDEIYRGK